MVLEVAETKVIGIGGVARVGKDTLCSEIIHFLSLNNIEAQRIAFADELKKDLYEFLLAKTGLSVYTEIDSEKKLIRPTLVEYGKLMRSLSEGMYWIEKLQPLITSNLKNNVVSIISDVRYKNEAKWVNSISGGVSIHIRRSGILPANEEESENDPLVCKHSRIKIDYPTLETEKISNHTQLYLNELYSNQRIQR